MLELVLARHGQSYGNLDRALGADTNLTDLGRAQATQLAQWLANQGYSFAAFYCSTLRRARQTAEIINAYHELEITYDPDLREADFWLVRALPQRAEPLAPQPVPPFERQYEAMRKRVMRATARILSENSSGQVLIVAHGGTLGTILRGILDSHALLLHTDLAAVHSLRWEDGRWNLRFVNRQEHLVALR